MNYRYQPLKIYYKYCLITLELLTYDEYLHIFHTNENNSSDTRKTNDYNQLCFDLNESKQVILTLIFLVLINAMIGVREIKITGSELREPSLAFTNV